MLHDGSSFQQRSDLQYGYGPLIIAIQLTGSKLTGWGRRERGGRVTVSSAHRNLHTSYHVLQRRESAVRFESNERQTQHPPTHPPIHPPPLLPSSPSHTHNTHTSLLPSHHTHTTHTHAHTPTQHTTTHNTTHSHIHKHKHQHKETHTKRTHTQTHTHTHAHVYVYVPARANVYVYVYVYVCEYVFENVYVNEVLETAT